MTAVSISIPVTPGDNLYAYMQQIKKFPFLTPEDEYMLAKRFKENGDTEAANSLVTSHLRLVAKIADGYNGYGLPQSEIISEGNIGLIQAVNKFEPDKGFRLSTYAIWWIRAAIQEYILHSWSLVKIGTTAAQKKLFFNLRKIKNKMEILENNELSEEQTEDIADKLSVSTKEVTDMNRRMSGQDQSLNAPLNDGEESSGEWLDWLQESSDNQEVRIGNDQDLSIKKRLLAKSFEVLNQREKTIISERRLKNRATTLEDLSQKFSVSRERIRQIEVNAIEKMRKFMMNKIKEDGLKL